MKSNSGICGAGWAVCGDPVGLVTVQRASELAQVSRRTVWAWIAAGWVEVVRTPGGHPRIVVQSLFRKPAGPGKAVQHDGRLV